MKIILDIFIDNPDKYEKEVRENLMAKANLLTPSILAGTATRKAVSEEWMQAAGMFGVVAIVTEPVNTMGNLTDTWLMKVSVNVDKKKKNNED